MCVFTTYLSMNVQVTFCGHGRQQLWIRHGYIGYSKYGYHSYGNTQFWSVQHQNWVSITTKTPEMGVNQSGQGVP